MELSTGRGVSSVFVMTATVPIAENDVPPCPNRIRFALLLKHVEADLLRAARRLCRGNEDRAQDVVQETLLRAFAACCSGQWDLGRASFRQARSYLLQTATNHYINTYWRRRKWEADVSVDDLTWNGETAPTSLRARAADVPGMTLAADTMDETIEAALSTLPENQRIIVLLVDVEERTYEQAAMLLEIPTGTVRSRLARARASLRERLHGFAAERRWIP